MGRAFDGTGRVYITHDRVGLLVSVTQFEEGRGDSVVDDLNHAAAHQLLKLDQRQIGLDSGRIAIHHETDGSGRSEDGYLGVSVAVLFAVGESFVPAGFRGFD